MQESKEGGRRKETLKLSSTLMVSMRCKRETVENIWEGEGETLMVLMMSHLSIFTYESIHVFGTCACVRECACACSHLSSVGIFHHKAKPIVRLESIFQRLGKEGGKWNNKNTSSTNFVIESRLRP